MGDHVDEDILKKHLCFECQQVAVGICPAECLATLAVAPVFLFCCGASFGLGFEHVAVWIAKASGAAVIQRSMCMHPNLIARVELSKQHQACHSKQFLHLHHWPHLTISHNLFTHRH